VDVLVASDILLYAEQYANLVQSLVQIFRHAHEAKLARRSSDDDDSTDEGAAGLVIEGVEYRFPVFLLNVARRLKSTPDFFDKMERAGFEIHHLRDAGANVAITHTLFNAVPPKQATTPE
jgi:hypothetical protein